MQTIGRRRMHASISYDTQLQLLLLLLLLLLSLFIIILIHKGHKLKITLKLTKNIDNKDIVLGRRNKTNDIVHILYVYDRAVHRLTSLQAIHLGRF